MTAFVGVGGLVRLILRRDRIILPLWVLLLAIQLGTYASAFVGLYTTDAARAEFATAMSNNPGLVALYGPIFNDSIGALTVWRGFLVFAIAGLASAFTVIRHTRTEEEAGRRELVGAAVVSRQAPLLAALLVTFAADLLLGLATMIGLSKVGLPATGSIMAGLNMAAIGWAFGAIAAVTAQLTQSARAARSLAGGALGLAYLLRAVGDVAGEGSWLRWLSWFSPLGWAQQARPFAGDRPWPLLLLVAFAVGLSVTAYRLNAGRDLDAGILPVRAGRATARASLRTPLALAWRLHRGVFFGWAAGFVVMGAVFGGAADAAADSLASNPQIAEFMAKLGGTAALADSFLAVTLSMLGLAVSGYAIQAALRLHGEEVNGRAEPVLATATGRWSWAGSHLIFAVLGPTVVLGLTGVVAGLVYGAATGDVGGQVPRLLGAALVQLPAVWLLAGLAVALFGLLPRLTALAWVALAAFALLGQFGVLLKLSHWAIDVSPFTHIPKLPGGTVQATPLIWLVALSVGLMLAGLIGLRRRDLS